MHGPGVGGHDLAEHPFERIGRLDLAADVHHPAGRAGGPARLARDGQPQVGVAVESERPAEAGDRGWRGLAPLGQLHDRRAGGAGRVGENPLGHPLQRTGELGQARPHPGQQAVARGSVAAWRTARRAPPETLARRLSAWPPFRKVSYPFWWVKLLTNGVRLSRGWAERLRIGSASATVWNESRTDERPAGPGTRDCPHGRRRTRAGPCEDRGMRVLVVGGSGYVASLVLPVLSATARDSRPGPATAVHRCRVRHGERHRLRGPGACGRGHGRGRALRDG